MSQEVIITTLTARIKELEKQNADQKELIKVLQEEEDEETLCDKKKTKLVKSYLDKIHSRTDRSVSGDIIEKYVKYLNQEIKILRIKEDALQAIHEALSRDSSFEYYQKYDKSEGGIMFLNDFLREFIHDEYFKPQKIKAPPRCKQSYKEPIFMKQDFPNVIKEVDYKIADKLGGYVLKRREETKYHMEETSLLMKREDLSDISEKDRIKRMKGEDHSIETKTDKRIIKKPVRYEDKSDDIEPSESLFTSSMSKDSMEDDDSFIDDEIIYESKSLTSEDALDSEDEEYSEDSISSIDWDKLDIN